MSTPTPSPLNSDELRCLESLIPFANESELEQIYQLLNHEPTSQGETAGTFRPTPRQAEFLALDCLEALYGGAAGGGKSEALLAWLAQGVNTPGYAGLIFRRTYPQLSKADGLIAKSFRMYKPLGGVWHGTDKRWVFPSGATIELGHLHLEVSKYDYQGPSYHRIAFDELTQFSETQYTFLFSRLRRTVGFPISIGMRGASNPGGEGHLWVKNRFVTREAIDWLLSMRLDEVTPPGAIFQAADRRFFVPSRLADNPYLDREEYEQTLSELDPLTRMRLLAGDWSIVEDARIKADWLRYWYQHGDYYRLSVSERALSVRMAECLRIITVDCAGSSEDVARERRGKRASWSVISTFDFHRASPMLYWVDVRRGKWEFPELVAQINRAFREMHPAWVGIEDEKTGRAALQMLRGLPTKPISHEGKDKLTRAARALNEFERGRIAIPQHGHNYPWKSALEDELLTWTGHDDDQWDQGDTLAHAVNHLPWPDKQPALVIGRIIAGKLG